MAHPNEWEWHRLSLIPAPIRPEHSPAMAELLRSTMLESNLAPWVRDGWEVVSVAGGVATLKRRRRR